MHLDLDPDEIIFFGSSVGILRWLDEQLPPSSVVLVEEPDVIRRRGVDRLVAGLPVISRTVAVEYQTGLDVDTLLAREPGLAAARLVVPGTEYAVTAAARLADRLGLPGAGPPAAEVFTDKHRMRRAAAAAGLANPAYTLVTGPQEAAVFAERFGGRCVLKPTRRAGSLGVQLITDREQIVPAWAATAAPAESPEATDRGLPSEVLVEQTLVGPEYSVELLVADGEVLFANVTDKRVLPGRRPVETGHTVPSALPPARQAELVAVTTRLAVAAGFGTGVLHSEWIVADGTPTLVECAARLPGDMITALVAAAYECAFIGAYLDVLRGGRPALPARASGAAAVEFLLAPPGTVTAVDGVRDALRAPGVLSVELDVRVGDTVGELVSSTRRSGHVLTWGADPAEATRAARHAAGLVRISVG
ncbi:ATP-grasp domain-containing protein [Micromonospora halophytica]|uniref:Biotin carboxylase n=1 Tax=Micromonospora halophytica TaxID=47864 RepID=A0A1C5IGS0_9ACTN|nr:ATP-grasp domain-containing protein [Micromonospora halophytica]SCG57628.1 Biotin carboxylase [Micromonospora halophytica]